MLAVPPRDLILAIETSNPSAWTPECRSRPGVALGMLEGGPAGLASPGERVLGGVLGVEPIRLDDPQHDDLQSAIARLFERCGATPERLARVAVSVGPGGYTALRVAVVATKMMSLATGAHCVPVPSAHVAARRATSIPARIGSGGPAAKLAVCLASKGDDCFVTLFGPDAPPTAGEILDAPAMPWDEVGRLVGDRFLPALVREEAARRGIAVEAPEFDPVACLEEGARANPVGADELLPIYPRIPEAIRKWRELGRGV